MDNWNTYSENTEMKRTGREEGSSNSETMTDLQLIDKFCEECQDFIDPRIFREIEKRGLVWAVNKLPQGVEESKAVIRARFAKKGRCFGDDEIDQIANTVIRIETLRDRLNKISMTEPHKVMPILNEMMTHSQFVRDYLKTPTP